MATTPAIKRRKLTPSPTNGDDSSLSTVQNIPETNAFFKQASSWNLEQDYETKPRKGKKKEKENTRLPIKTSDGLVQQVYAPEVVDDVDSDLEWLGAEELEEEELVKEDKPTIPIRQQIIEAKEELARIAMMLNQDPEENVGAFKTLAQFGQSQNTTIKKLALATQLAVYKDVIPGYRIRPLSDDDMETKVSKEVKKLRAYEQALVGGYQGYVRELSKLASSGRAASDGGPSLTSVAISCACALLTAIPHFNFRGDLLKILVGKLSNRKVDDDFIKCRETIEILFRNDDDGTASLDAVSILTKMMKARGYRFDESVLNTFLHLRLLSEFSWKASINHIDKPLAGELSSKKVKDKRVFRTKKERKILKERKVVEKEMVQADATVSHEERDRMQSETLKLVFVTYFRILKLRSPSLMGAVLEGLARYAHLINQDFFGDLLEALKDLIGHAVSGDDFEETETKDDTTTRNLTREALLCIITAFALLEGQDAAKAKAALSLDLSFFITHLYRTLHALSLNPDIELSPTSLHLPDPSHPSSTHIPSTANNKINIQTMTVLLLRSLSSILTPALAPRAIPPLRIAAFTKQLFTISLHLPEKSCLAMIGLLQKITKVHESKIKGLWNTEERRGDGVFDGLSQEVDGSNPFASTVWEGELLRRHFCPGVRDLVKGVERNVSGTK
ncbi:hypothetical protein B7494_g4156 [Chlorociboria aeruginascens]|nr:hypothetical protein B7494_g4156 [Chlorociboria aeruginascens]